MERESKTKSVFFELLFFEHGYPIYYSKIMHEMLGIHLKHSY